MLNYKKNPTETTYLFAYFSALMPHSVKNVQVSMRQSSLLMIKGGNKADGETFFYR